MATPNNAPSTTAWRQRLQLVLVIFGLGCNASVQAEDWPQFLGPRRDNTSQETVPIWTKPPQLLWRQPVGEAHSSPVVAQGKVFAFYKPKDRHADALAAFDARTGERLWENSYERDVFTPPFGVGPRGTPAVASDRVVTLGNTGVLAAWNLADGKILWKVDTLKQFQAKNLFFGVSTSPIILKDQVVVMVGGKNAGIVSFALSDGHIRWQKTSDKASYAGPMFDGEQLVFLTGDHLRGITPAGEELWNFPFVDKLNESSTTPARAGELIVAGSVTRGSFAFPRTGQANKPVWLNDKLTCYFSTPCVVGEDLYMVNGAATLVNPSIVFRCVEAKTGKIRWEQKNFGKYHAAMIVTGDQKLLSLDDLGQLTLIQPDPSGYKELAKAKVCGPTWAHPALSNGVVYLRDDKELLAIRLSE